MLKDVVEADVRQFIEGDEELFFNERDFQMHLAVYLRSLGKYDDVDIEYYVPQKELDRYLWENELRLDIVVSKNGEYVPIELKYKTKAVSRPMTRFGERLSEKIPVMKIRERRTSDATIFGRMYDALKWSATVSIMSRAVLRCS